MGAKAHVDVDEKTVMATVKIIDSIVGCVGLALVAETRVGGYKGGVQSQI